jgi:hypothetical protein
MGAPWSAFLLWGPAPRSRFQALRQVSQERADERDTFADRSSRTVDNDVFAVPGAKVAPDRPLPVWQDQAGNFARPRFDAPTMFLRIRADNFDFDDPRTRAQPRIASGVSRQHPRIDGISDDCQPEAA